MIKCIRPVLSCCIAAVCCFPLSASVADAGGSHAGGSPPADVSTVLQRQPADPAAKVQDSPVGSFQEHIAPVTVYYQNDPAWAQYLYGGKDPMSAYGCGPTALAMAVTSLTGAAITPVDAAQWSAANGYYSSGSGSAHSLILDGARHYGLMVEKITPLTPDFMRLALSMDKLLVLLMGPGDFSDSGHFIIAYGYDADGNILVADPASPDRSSAHWPAETLIAQLSSRAKNGGPAWVLSKL